MEAVVSKLGSAAIGNGSRRMCLPSTSRSSVSTELQRYCNTKEAGDHLIRINRLLDYWGDTVELIVRPMKVRNRTLKVPVWPLSRRVTLKGVDSDGPSCFTPIKALST